MSCYSPLLLTPVGVNLDTGKTKYAIGKLKNDSDREGKKIVPCGSCIGCRIDYARQWADRCMLEAQDHDTNYFLTLTYDDEHIGSCINYYSDENGEAFPIASLRKRDLQLFHKSLRKALDEAELPKIRFFACGEYGSPENSMRPHFHDIVFGLKLTDLKFYKYNKNRQPLYTSDFLNSIWKKGFVIVGEVSWQSCAYVARYVTKKLKGDDARYYSDFNIEPPFVVMSRKPGIARNYYDKHPELFDFNYFNLSTEDGGRKIYPPRYFKKLLEVDDYEKFCEVHDRLEMSANIRNDSRDMISDLDMIDQLSIEKSSFENRVRVLTRKEV